MVNVRINEKESRVFFSHNKLISATFILLKQYELMLRSCSKCYCIIVDSINISDSDCFVKSYYFPLLYLSAVAAKRRGEM